MRNCWQACK